MVSKQPFVAPSGSDLLKPILPSGAMALKPSYGKNAYFIPTPTLDSRLVGQVFIEHTSDSSDHGQDIFEIGHCFWREIRVSSQDPNMIHVKKPDDCGTGVHEGIVLIVGGQDPVRS